MTKNLVIVESPTKSKLLKIFRAQLYCPRFNGTFARFAKSLFGVDIEHDLSLNILIFAVKAN